MAAAEDSAAATPRPSGPDPAGIETVEDLAEALRAVQVRSGKSLRQLESWGSQHRKPLSRSSLSDFLNGRRLPSKSTLLRFLEACAVSPAEAPKWEDARARLAARQYATDDTEAEPPGNLKPPQDLVAERSLLGAMLLSSAAIAGAVSVVRAEDFYQVEHGRIFKAVVDRYRNGEPVDPVTVGAALSRGGDLDTVGGGDYLGWLAARLPPAPQAVRYAGIVAECSRLRQLMEAGLRIAQVAASPSDEADGRDTDDVIDFARRTILDLTDRLSSAHVERAPKLAALLQPVLDQIEAAGIGEQTLAGISTGFADLDRLINGLRPGELIAIAGDVSIGKSTLAMDFARNAAVNNNLAAALFTAEMTKVDTVMRLLAAEGRIPLHVIRSGQLSDEDWARLATCMSGISEAPLFIEDTADIGRWEIWQKCQQLNAEHDLKLVVVDSPMMVLQPNARESLEDLKLLARRLDCAVVFVSPLKTRPKRGQMPWLAHIPDEVAAIADTVILIDREDHYERETPRAGEADLIVVKQRNGPVDTITVAAQLHLSRFVDLRWIWPGADVRGIDLRYAVLTEAVLDNVLWSKATRWPAKWVDFIERNSVPEGDAYRCRPGAATVAVKQPKPGARGSSDVA